VVCQSDGPAKADELIVMWFGLLMGGADPHMGMGNFGMSSSRYTESDSAGADWSVVDGSAHWHRLANTIKPSVCNGNGL